MGSSTSSATTPSTASGSSAARPACPTRGMQPGRQVQFTNEDHADVRDLGRRGRAHHVAVLHPRRGDRVLQGSEYGNFDIRSVHPDHKYIENTDRHEGTLPQRHRSSTSTARRRRSASWSKEALFKDEPAIGKNIRDQRDRLQGRGRVRGRRRRGRDAEDLPADHDRPAHLQRRQPGCAVHGHHRRCATLEESEEMVRRDSNERMATRHRLLAGRRARGIRINNNNEDVSAVPQSDGRHPPVSSGSSGSARSWRAWSVSATS